MGPGPSPRVTSPGSQPGFFLADKVVLVAASAEGRGRHGRFGCRGSAGGKRPRGGRSAGRAPGGLSGRPPSLEAGPRVCGVSWPPFARHRAPWGAARAPRSPGEWLQPFAGFHRRGVFLPGPCSALRLSGRAGEGETGHPTAERPCTGLWAGEASVSGFVPHPGDRLGAGHREAPVRGTELAEGPGRGPCCHGQGEDLAWEAAQGLLGVKAERAGPGGTSHPGTSC